MDTIVDPHVIEATHGGPWLSLDQARVEPLPVGERHIPMEETTLDQFMEALHGLIERSYLTLSHEKARHRRKVVKGILAGLGGDEYLDIVHRWYLMEELEHLGIIFPTTLARKKAEEA